MKNTELYASPHPCRDKFFLRVLLKVNEQDELAYWAGENTYQRQRWVADRVPPCSRTAAPIFILLTLAVSYFDFLLTTANTYV